ncbi:MAG TPA: MDR family oxidoreductase [Solirubrobacterales bacterium]|nr:MDR family oxidoreductase [Solirubrobacterales bacterium]
MFQALLISDTEDPPKATYAELEDEQLTEGEVAIDVEFSSLNYKDALAITGTAPIARRLPMIPGIDVAGTVTESAVAGFAPGDQVIATGHGIGEKHWGGLAQRARLEGEWLTALPAGLSLHDAMAVGTAGLTAMLAVMRLEEEGLEPGEVLVTGAGGGVGSFAVAILAARGHEVVASTGRPEQEGYLRELGAASVIDRAELAEPGKALGKQRWAGAVDAVGGQTLANVCATLRYGGTVAACGNAGGMKLPATVAPFILRGVTLAGIDSVEAAAERRAVAWERIAALDRAVPASVAEDIALSETIAAAEKVLAGQVRGRLVVDPSR